MKIWRKIKRFFKKLIKAIFFRKEARFKKTDLFQSLRSIAIDRYFIRNIKKGEYATVKAKKMNYRMEKKGILTDERKEALLAKVFEKQHGYKINFRNPKTFNEKLMWMKLYYQGDFEFCIQNKAGSGLLILLFPRKRTTNTTEEP